MKIAAYIAALRLKQQLKQRQQERDARIALHALDDARRAENYGENDNEAAFYLLVDNFR